MLLFRKGMYKTALKNGKERGKNSAIQTGLLGATPV
jgi:hypothetical protein